MNKQKKTPIPDSNLVTILCQTWKEDTRYLKEFIEHHASIGVKDFFFIIDTYSEQFQFNFPASKEYKIQCANGVSKESKLPRRQIENYNHFIHQIKTEYVCVIDADEFLHPKTIRFLTRHKPQSIELPWRIMCPSNSEKDSDKRQLYSGIIVPQRKSISKVKDIIHVNIHGCVFKQKGKSIRYGRTIHIPVNHFYIRDSLELELSQAESAANSPEKDPHFSGRLLTMRLMHSMCIRFHEYQQHAQLSEPESNSSPIKQPSNPKTTTINEPMIYLYLFIKSIIWVSWLTRSGLTIRIRDLPTSFDKLKKSRGFPAKASTTATLAWNFVMTSIKRKAKQRQQKERLIAQS